MKAKKKYQFRWIRGGLQIEVAHAEPVLGNIEIHCVSPVMN
jgi:hypothetical protein